MWVRIAFGSPGREQEFTTQPVSAESFAVSVNRSDDRYSPNEMVGHGNIITASRNSALAAA